MFEVCDCQLVWQCIKDGTSGPIPYSSKTSIQTAVPTYMHLFVCCSEKKQINPGPRKLLANLTELAGADLPIHGVFVQYCSQVERLISVEGSSKNAQIYFEDILGNGNSRFFFEGEFCAKPNSQASALQCGEMFAVIHKSSLDTAITEIISADISIFESTAAGKWAPANNNKYDFKIQP